jgi:hypothetical protein
MNKGVEAFRAQLQKELGLSMQHQLHNAIYRPTLTVLSLARAAGWRPRCRRRFPRKLYVFITEWPAYLRNRGGMRHSSLTRVGQPEDLS